MPEFVKVTRGNRIRQSAREFNASLDAIKRNYSDRMSGQGAALEPMQTYGSVQWISNDTGKNIDQYGVIGVDGPMVLPTVDADRFKNSIIWNGALPKRGEQFAIALSPVKATFATRFVTQGIVQAYVDIKSEEHGYAQATDNDVTSLESGTTGVEILWKETATGTGKMWCIIRIGQKAAATATIARFIQFEAKTAFKWSDATFDATVIDYWEGLDPDPTAAGLTIANTCTTRWNLSDEYNSQGTCGIARWNERYNDGEGRYELVYISQPEARFIEFLTDGVVQKTDDEFPVSFSNPWDGIRWGQPGGQPAIVKNTRNMFEAAAPLTPGIARLNINDTQPAAGVQQDYVYQCVYMPPIVGASDQAEVIRFELNGDMALTDPFQSATVKERYNGAIPALESTVTVHNTCNDFGGVTGTCGLAYWNTTDQQYQIIVLWEKYARFIEFTVDADFNKADNFFNVTQGAFWDGIAPAPAVTQVVNTGNMFKGYAGWKGIARYDYFDAEYQAVYVTHNWALRWIEFDTTTEFLPTDPGPHTVNVTGYYNGLDPGATVDVMNTKGIFRSNGAGFGGVATEEEDGTWKIIQLKCEPPANQTVIASDSIPSYDNDPQVHIPFEEFSHSAGDLYTINAQGEAEMLRATRGALRVTIGAHWFNQLGPSDPDQSILQLQESIGGGGWTAIPEAGLLFTHTYLRIPPNNYILGGSAERSYWSRKHFSAGDKIRVVAWSANDTLITSLEQVTFEVIESYEEPLAP